MCSATDDPSMIDVVVNSEPRTIGDVKINEQIRATIPYSLCGQAMFTLERLNAHNKVCEWCKARLRG